MNNSADIRASRALAAALHTHTLKYTHKDISLKMMMYNKGSGRRKKEQISSSTTKHSIKGIEGSQIVEGIR